MRQRILKFSFVLFLILAGFSGRVAFAADSAAFVLHVPSGNNTPDININKTDLAEWKIPSDGQDVVFDMSPESNSYSYLQIQLGLKDKPSSHLYFSKFNVPAIYKSLKGLEATLNQEPAEPVLKVENKKVVEFNPGTNGVVLDVTRSIDTISQNLENGKTEADLTLATVSPVKSLGDVNNYGIKELVGRGVSNYTNSPNNRIFNIKVGVKNETGILIAPGDEFSFNKYLGPVDGEHGFLPELVIKKEGTIPEFGGGLCQVSTTTFRAAMNAGLPITARRNHSYAVSYYSPQGTDATIYPGVQDLKWINDTKNYILVWPSFPEKNKLQFDLYGTKDGRKIEVGTPRSYDRKPDGSLKAIWERTVTMPDGQEKKDTFYSNYQPPALFHHTTTAASPVPPASPPATPSPAPTNSTPPTT